MTDNQVTTSTFVRMSQALHETKDEAGCHEAEAKNFDFEDLTSLAKTQQLWHTKHFNIKTTVLSLLYDCLMA